MMASVLSTRLTPTNLVRSHLVPFIDASAWAMLRDNEHNSAMPCSAAATVLAVGALTTRQPYCKHATAITEQCVECKWTFTHTTCLDHNPCNSPPTILLKQHPAAIFAAARSRQDRHNQSSWPIANSSLVHTTYLVACRLGWCRATNCVVRACNCVVRAMQLHACEAAYTINPDELNRAA